MTEVAYFAPGRVLICGEYAMNAPGGEALAAAVSAGVMARASTSRQWEVSLGLLSGGPGRLISRDGVLATVQELTAPERREFRFVQAALNESVSWLFRECGVVDRFRLEVTAKGDPLGPIPERPHRLGLGSSAAATVATVAAVLGVSGFDPTTSGGRNLVHRLAGRAHLHAMHGRGTDLDVATSVFGGVVWFRNGHGGTQVEPVSWLEDLRILVGWNKQHVDEEPRNATVEAFRHRHPAIFDRFVGSSRAWTRTLLQALKAGERTRVLRALARHRRLLNELGDYVGLQMETAELRALSREGGGFGVAKSCGFGGADRALMVLRSPDFLAQAETALGRCQLSRLNLSVPVTGLTSQAFSPRSRIRGDY